MIKLKPQWWLRELTKDQWTLTSEAAHFQISANQGTTLQKIVSGVDITELTDDEFSVIQYFSDRGFLEHESNADSPFWELSGLNYHSFREQLLHVTLAIVDLTPNGVGKSVLETLQNSNVTLVSPEEATVTLMFVNSFQDMTDHSGTVLPVLCNRAKITMGPLVFPWGTHVKDRVARTQTFMHTVSYELPLAVDLLQRAWISFQVLNFVGGPRQKFAGYFVEYDLAKQEFNTWPA